MLLCAHPSREGLKSGESSRGSTAWSNAVRNRLYLRREGEDGDPQRRFSVLELKKRTWLGAESQSVSCGMRACSSGAGGPRQSPLSEDDEGVIAEVEHAFNAEKPWSAPSSGWRSVVGALDHDNARKRPGRPQRALLTAFLRLELVEIDTTLHRHRSGLCTPEQAENFARERAAMKRTS